MLSGEVLAVVYGLASAASWGAGDFHGGLASKRASAYVVVWFSQLVGGLFLLLLALSLEPVVPPPRTLLLGGAAGLVGVAALVALYAGLARGRMGLVAPLTAIVAGGAPVAAAAVLDGLPSPAKMAGFAVALGGIWLLAGTGRSAGLHRSDLFFALAAGLGFAAFFVIIDRASERAVLWPLVSARLASLLALALLLGGRFRGVFGGGRRPWGLAGIMALAGIFDVGGNAFFALATRTGRLDVAAVLASLYPLSIILLARGLLQEELSRR